jgi:Gly-Xaa carboxypeptidase
LFALLHVVPLHNRSAVETLVASGFRPTRTVVLAFGFDEEANGLEGAWHLASHLEKLYGENGIAMIVDEGAGFVNKFGSVIAILAIAEKGYLNVVVKVTSPGGHSSVPPAHTVTSSFSHLVGKVLREC